MASQNSYMEPRFSIPLGETGLILAARIVLMWSQVEWFSDRILEAVYRLNHNSLIVLTGEKTSRIDLLKNSTRFIKDASIRSEAETLCANMVGLKGDRNLIVHGMWGHYNPEPDKYDAAALSHKRKEPLLHSDLIRIHDAICPETFRAVRIFTALGGPSFEDGQKDFYFGPT